VLVIKKNKFAKFFVFSLNCFLFKFFTFLKGSEKILHLHSSAISSVSLESTVIQLMHEGSDFCTLPYLKRLVRFSMGPVELIEGSRVSKTGHNHSFTRGLYDYSFHILLKADMVANDCGKIPCLHGHLKLSHATAVSKSRDNHNFCFPNTASRLPICSFSSLVSSQHLQ